MKFNTNCSRHLGSSELYRTNAQADAVFTDLRHLCDPADLSLELRQVACSTEGTFDNRFAPVDGSVCGGTDVKWIVFIVLEVVRVGRSLFARRQNLTSLLRDVRLRSELEKSAGEGGGRLEVLEFEEEIESGSQRQNHVHGLHVAVREVRCHLARSFLFVKRLLRKLFASDFHLQSDDVLLADVNQLLGLCDVLFLVDDKQRNAEQNQAELLDGFLELSLRRNWYATWRRCTRSFSFSPTAGTPALAPASFQFL